MEVFISIFIIWVIMYHLIKLLKYSFNEEQEFNTFSHKYTSFSDHMEWYANQNLNLLGMIIIALPMYLVSTIFITMNHLVNIFGNAIYVIKFVFFRRSK